MVALFPKTARQSLLGFVLWLCATSVAGASEHPNIVFILADDVGWGDIRSNNPNGKVSLPTIERLAREGIRFTDAHTSAAKCAPSRSSIISGNYQWRGRFESGTWDYKGGSQLLPGQETLGDLLKRAGYATAIVGKYQLGADFYGLNSNDFASAESADTSVDFARAMVDGPNDKGFDYSFVAMRGIQGAPYAFFENGLLYGDSSSLINWRVGDYGDTQIPLSGIGLPSWVTRDVGPTLLSKSIEFIESQKLAQASEPVSRPFFLYLNTEAVHGPHKPPVAINDRLILGTSGLGARADMLVELDVVVDNILRKLEQLGLMQDTLVIFSSDNGGVKLTSEARSGHQTSGGFRGDKGTVYEGGHRVPFILKWGPQAFGSSPLPQGSVSNALVGIQDLYATLAEMTGVPVTPDQGRDSFSLLPILMGQTGATRDHMVHEADTPEDNASGGGISGRHFAYRSGSWKLVFNSAKVPIELYNLAVDPFETTNLRSQPAQSDRVDAMKFGLDKAMSSDRTAPPVGTTLVSVPDVSGLSQALAEESIVGANLTVGAVSEQGSPAVPVGHVITQDPVGGALATVGAPVNLVVSTGVSSIPDYSLSPTTVVFGSQLLNLTSSTQVITLSNGGGSTLTITSIGLSGPNAAEYSQIHTCASTLPSDGECKISVNFKPISAGTKSALLTVVAADGAGTKYVNLSGTGVKAGLSVSPSSLSFGNVARGSTSAAKTVAITNTGILVLPIPSIVIAGSNPGQFKQTSNCTAQVPAGGVCTVTVTFKPTSKGSKTARLRITVGGGADTKSVALSGNGT